MRFTSQTISGIVLLVAGVGQFLGMLTFPIWLLLVCVGLIIIMER